MHVLINQMDAVLNAMEHAHSESEKDIGISIISLIVEHHRRQITKQALAVKSYADQASYNQSTNAPPHLIA